MTNSNFFVEILFDSTLIKLSTQKKFMMQSRPGAAGGHFGGPTPPKSLLVPPQISACAPKESDRPGASGVHFGACAPESVSKISFQEEKTRVNAKTEPKISRRRPLFWSSPLS